MTFVSKNIIWKSASWLFFAMTLFLFVFFNAPQNASAHPFDYGAINTNFTISGNTIQLQSNVPKNLLADATTSEAQLLEYETYFNENLTIQASGTPCQFALKTYDAVSSSTLTTFGGLFTCASDIRSIRDLNIHNTLFADFFQNFDHFITISLAQKQWVLAFSPSNTDYPQSVAAVDVYGNGDQKTASSSTSTSTSPQNGLSAFFASFISIAKQFTWLGMMHIWTGYDHILFIISIVLLVRSIRKILILVTSFTIAHSITLILAGLQIITLSPRIVEPLIALTIAYVAFRNLMQLFTKNDTSHLGERWVTTFGFGLIHGLGFAGSLVEVGIPHTFFVPALLIFNVGIEIGQMTILLLAIPLLLLIDRSPQRKKLLIFLSAFILLLASFWFVQRVL